MQGRLRGYELSANSSPLLLCGQMVLLTLFGKGAELTSSAHEALLSPNGVWPLRAAQSSLTLTAKLTKSNAASCGVVMLLFEADIPD